MKIAAASTSMEAARTYTEVNSFTLGLTTNQQAQSINANPFSTRFRSLIRQPTENTTGLQKKDIEILPAQDKNNPAPCQETVQRLAGEIVGEPVRLLATDHGHLSTTTSNSRSTSMQATITSRLIHYEREEVYFSTTGSISVEDGRELSFSLDLSMQRTSKETLELSMQGGLPVQYLMDPLVLSFSGGPPSFSSTSFLFDLDCDGKEEKLAGLQPGCGFLAFDQNDDGIINNGMELFGPQSGNGFTDLASLDTDQNQWIDENDPVFEMLSIWAPDDQGRGHLQSLKEAGVGAISLSSAGTQFTLQGKSGELLAKVQANGIFLTEKGEVRSLQEVDLALSDPEEDDGPNAPSRLTTVLDAMTSLRIIIAIQRMRARLVVARGRLQHHNPVVALAENSFPRHHHMRKQQQKPLTKATDQMRTPLGGEALFQQHAISQSIDRRSRFLQQQETLLHPILSLDEIPHFSWPGKPGRDKNAYSSR